MYKISVPIALQSMDENNLERDLNKYLEYFKKGKVSRVFFAILPPVYTQDFETDINSKKLERSVDFFKKNGLEVGVWIGGFGHGSALSHDSDAKMRENYRQITGVGGESFSHGYCPLDKNFRKDYLKSVKEIAVKNPHIIMFDDDFRLNVRRHYLGCFCEEHLKKYRELLGEEITREEIEKNILTGSENKYRSAYMDLMGETLLDFAKEIRNAVDEINPKIRLGICTGPSVWDLEGTDGVRLAKVLSGETKPLLRIFGAPYWSGEKRLADVIETERMLSSFSKKTAPEIEVMAEGDVYPRPRYNVSSKSLELFDLALYCDGTIDGNLKYIFDYTTKVGYETGYIDKHIKNLDSFEKIKELFEGKTSTGVTVFNEIHKIRSMDLPKKLEEVTDKTDTFPINIEKNLLRMLEHSTELRSSYVLSENAIPTCFEKSEYPVFVYGENAKYISGDDLENGAVLDAVAAEILAKRGFDTGLLKTEELNGVTEEYYEKENDRIMNFDVKLKKLFVKEGAKVLSQLLPQKCPGAYLYKNENKKRFLVFPFDLNLSPKNANYFNNYYRQKQLVDGIEWVGKKPLPAVCTKHPELYVMTSKSKNALSVLLINLFCDDIESPVITLDKCYKQVEFVNCNGEMKENKVYLKDIPPFGYCAFEVK